MTAPTTRTSGSPILGPRDMSPSVSDAGAFAPNFHGADEAIRETETETNIKPVTTSAPSSEPQSKEVSPSASPRIRISFKGGSSEPESPASLARDVPPSSSAQPSDSNSNSSAHTSSSEAPSLPATTINTVATGSISGNIAPLSPSRRPFSFRDVSDINEPSQIRVQSARLHHDAYDPKKSCACCERQEKETDKDKDKEKDKESEIKGADANTAKAHTDTNGTTKNKTATTSPTSASASASAPASSSPRAKKPSPWFGLCGICIAIRNCLAPEDLEYRCLHGRPCSNPKHRHSKGC